MLVVITGIDGAGKSTLASSVSHGLCSSGKVVHIVKPALFANETYQRYREALDFLADSDEVFRHAKSQLILLETCSVAMSKVKPLLNSRNIVICDRYFEASIAYLKTRELCWLDLDLVARYLPQPDISIFVDVPVQIAAERLTLLHHDVDGKMLEFLASMKEHLHEWAKASNGVHVLDGTLPIDHLTATIVDGILRETGNSGDCLS